MRGGRVRPALHEFAETIFYGPRIGTASIGRIDDKWSALDGLRSEGNRGS